MGYKNLIMCDAKSGLPIYEVTLTDGSVTMIENPTKLPDRTLIKDIKEPYIKTNIFTPSEYVGSIMELCQDKRGIYKNMSYIDTTRVNITYDLPLSEIVYDFFDKLKSYTKGYASFDYEFIGNYAASGTEIIKELGLEHMKTGKIIIYTSADSVLQLAANEEVVSVPELYRVCEIARKITLENPDWMVGRIIARPFVGTTPENFTRTPRRHDYAIKPFGRTCLDILKDNKLDVIAIGKIRDIFDGEGITEATKIVSNHDGMLKTIDIAKNKDFHGLCFVNLVDFDALYGHRRNPVGYANCLEEFDNDLNELLKYISDDDLLMICADHGNDPVHSGTDHTREYIPLIVYGTNINPIDLGTRKTYADIGTTICDNFNLKGTGLGISFLKDISK